MNMKQILVVQMHMKSMEKYKRLQTDRHFCSEETHVVKTVKTVKFAQTKPGEKYTFIHAEHTLKS